MLTRIKTIRAAFANTARNLFSAQGQAEHPVAMDALEPRQLMAVTIINAIPDGILPSGSQPSIVNLAGRYDNPALNGTIAKFNTDLGAIYVELANNATPITVANFLRYISEGRYNDTIIHRNALTGNPPTVPFVIQGGGFQRPNANNVRPGSIATFESITNEPGISNVRGTLAMAKLGSDANSATSQWFFNLNNANTFLNTTNGGFTVFGRVIGDGMNIVDAIAGLEPLDANGFYGTPNGAFGELPLRNFTEAPVKPENFVGMTISTVPEITYTATSNNAALASPVLDGNNLSLNYGAGQTGVATITVRATAADGSFSEDVFTVTLAGPPSIGALASSPQPSVTQGELMTLTAQNISDPLRILSKVQFFRDANEDGIFQADMDTLLGEDNAPSQGWSLKFSTANMPLGNNRFFARSVTTTGTFGEAATVIAGVTPPPSVGTLTSDVTPIGRGGTFNLSAGELSLPGAALKQVDFYRDTDGNGVFDSRIDKKVGSSGKVVNGLVTVKVSSKGFGVGDTMFFARITDKNKIAGPATAATIAVANSAPTAGRLKITPASVKNPGDPIALSVSGQKDVDGKVVRVQYFRDTEVGGDVQPNGVFDAEDVMIGEATTGGFKFNFLTTGLVGSQRFFARFIDNDGGMSVVVAGDVFVNIPPVLQSFVVSPESGPTTTAFTASIGAADSNGTIKTVEVFRDTNGDGVYDSRDKSLGKAKLIGGVWTLAIAGKKLSIGENKLFARATDNGGGFSTASSATVTIA